MAISLNGMDHAGIPPPPNNYTEGRMAEKDDGPLSAVLGRIKDVNGVEFVFDKSTHVAIRDSRGRVKIFARNERSTGTVNTRLYAFYGTKRYDEPKGRVRKQKPFVASVVPFEPDPNKGFIPFVNYEKEEGN